MLDSVKFLEDKNKKSESNRLYRLLNNDSLKKKDTYLQKRHSLISMKSRLKRKLNRLAWNDSLERKKINLKIKDIQFKIDTTKRIS